MKDFGIVRGSKEQAREIVIGKDTVYVHTDIKEIKTEDGGALYEYHEVQYCKDEYIELMAEANKDLEEQVTNAQLALAEIYEMTLGGGKQNG